MTETAARLRESLEQTVAILEAGDARRARESAAQVELRCREAELAGIRLSGSEVDRLRELFERCERAAQVLRNCLAASVVQAGASRRATVAYRRR